MLIDTHTHLYSEEFKEDLVDVIERAKTVGVKKFFLPAIDSAHTNNMLMVKNKYPLEVFLMAGLHPTYVNPETVAEELNHVKQNIDLLNVIAVGEIGIDLYWKKKYLKEQQEAFKTQIQWAKEHDLPIVIHCRDSFDEIFEVLEEEKGDKLCGVLHCFSGNLDQAKKTIDYGLKLGIGGVVTFKNGKIDQFLDQINVKHIVLETDSPYLAPVPYRGKRNESSYLVPIVEKLASIYGVSEEEIERTTTQNALDLFGLL
jgi:TatD DNase family protein